MKIRNRWNKIIPHAVLLTIWASLSSAQTFTVLKRFNLTNGSAPSANLVQGTDGNLYGTTYAGGANSNGTIFRFTTAGGLRSLYSFCASSGCPDGANPAGGLMLGSTGYFYGVTQTGGANTIGTIFQVKPTGRLQTQYSFCALANCADGAQPVSALIQGMDGNFYGEAMDGGANGNYGTIYQFRYFRPSGVTVLHSFCAFAGCTDGAVAEAPLVQTTDGNFYGIAASFGAHNRGTFFQMTPGGTFTTLYAFCALANCTDGAFPAQIILGTDGNFYGITSFGGTSTSCTSGCGTIFRVTTGGSLTTLHSFNLTDGDAPVGLVEGTDGNFYGVTELGGAHNKGTIFQMKPDDTVTTLHSFASSDGTEPSGTMVQATDGNFYGTARFGGSANNGTIFRLSMGLGPFIKLLPAAGSTGSVIQILGNNLTGSTSVTFNGAPSGDFIVVSPTLIYANVPTGATSGPVKVATPGGTLTSNVPFQVLP